MTSVRARGQRTGSPRQSRSPSAKRSNTFSQRTGDIARRRVDWALGEQDLRGVAYDGARADYHFSAAEHHLPVGEQDFGLGEQDFSLGE